MSNVIIVKVYQNANRSALLALVPLGIGMFGEDGSPPTLEACIRCTKERLGSLGRYSAYEIDGFFYQGI